MKKTALEKRDENFEFRAFLKGSDIPEDELDSLVHDLFSTISSMIDCRTCANCCKVIQPMLKAEDIDHLASGLGLTSSQFKSAYLIEMEDEEPGNFTFREMPCPFLKDNLCQHYDCRPEDCRSFPHLDKDEFSCRLIDVVNNCEVCPIVFLVYEALKTKL